MRSAYGYNPTLKTGQDSVIKIIDSDTQQEDVLLGTKLLHLCYLSYKNSRISKQHSQKEAEWIAKLGIENYKIWDLKHKNETSDEEIIASQAVSGYISNPTKSMPGVYSFISFRGTVSLHDLLADILSLIPATFTTAKGTKVGATSGAGMLATFSFWREQGLLKYIIESVSEHNGLLICGHSLGGAIGNLLTAEILTDYPDIFKPHSKSLRLVTFGSPRVFDKHYAMEMEHLHSRCNYRHIRFVNDSDIITTLPSSEFPFVASAAMKIFEVVAGHCRLYHTGTAYFAPSNGEGLKCYPVASNFNFAPEPDYKDSWSLLELILNFGASFGDPHFLESRGGYLDRLMSSIQFQAGLDSQPEEIRKSFENLPLDILPSDPLKSTLQIAVKMGLDVARRNYPSGNALITSKASSIWKSKRFGFSIFVLIAAFLSRSFLSNFFLSNNSRAPPPLPTPHVVCLSVEDATSAMTTYLSACISSNRPPGTEQEFIKLTSLSVYIPYSANSSAVNISNITNGTDQSLSANFSEEINSHSFISGCQWMRVNSTHVTLIVQNALNDNTSLSPYARLQFDSFTELLLAETYRQVVSTTASDMVYKALKRHTKWRSSHNRFFQQIGARAPSISTDEELLKDMYTQRE